MQHALLLWLMHAQIWDSLLFGLCSLLCILHSTHWVFYILTPPVTHVLLQVTRSYRFEVSCYSVCSSVVVTIGKEMKILNLDNYVNKRHKLCRLKTPSLLSCIYIYCCVICSYDRMYVQIWAGWEECVCMISAWCRWFYCRCVAG